MRRMGNEHPLKHGTGGQPMHYVGDILEVVITEKTEEAGKILYRVGERDSPFVVDEFDAYQRGLNDAWEAARNIQMIFPMDKNEEIFGTKINSLGRVMHKYSVNEVVKKLREYERKIQVGDEVLIGSKTCVITSLKDGLARYVDMDGITYANFADAEVKKTGRHFPQIAEVLKLMQEPLKEEDHD